MDFNENFILGCSAIGAGLAVIAGIGPGVGPVSYTHLTLPTNSRPGYRSRTRCCSSRT